MSEPLLAAHEDESALAEVSALAARAEAGIEPLLAMLPSHGWAVRRAIVQALSDAPAAALPLLVSSLVMQRSSEPIVSGLVDALSASRVPVELNVRQLLDDPSPAIVCDAIQILGRRRDADSVARLVELTEHVDDNVALSAIEALGRIGGQEPLQRLLELAEGSNFFRVFPAIEALGRCRDERALPALTRFLDKPLYAPEAARALGRLGSIQAVPSLLRVMTRGPESNVAIGAASLVAIDTRVGELGPKSAVRRAVREHAEPGLRDRLARAMSFADSKEQLAIGRVLVWLATAESVSDLLRLLTNGAEDVSSLALQGLTELSKLGEPQLLQLLQSGSSELRAKLLPHLVGLGVASEAVAACLHDPQASVRALACHALSRGSSTRVVPRLFELLKDPDLGVVHAAIGAIQSLGSEETERLALAAARSSNSSERRAALRIVTYLGYDESFQLCADAIAGDDERLRDIALSALPNLDDPRATPLLLEAAQQGGPRTRAAALRALGNTTATPEVKAALDTALDDVDAWARYYACQALGKLGDGAALGRIVARLADPAGQVRMAAVEALSRIPGAAATRALSEIAQTQDAEMARAAIVGIGERGEAALRPIVEQALRSDDATLRLVAVSSVARLGKAQGELGRIVQSDADPSVRRAAFELLANDPSELSTTTLLELLEAEQDAALYGLAQHLEARLPVLAVALGAATDVLARQILSVLSRTELPSARRVVDQAFGMPNVSVRRAAAKVLSLLLDDEAKSSLARAASADPDPEVRRISALAIA